MSRSRGRPENALTVVTRMPAVFNFVALEDELLGRQIGLLHGLDRAPRTLLGS